MIKRSPSSRLIAPHRFNATRMKLLHDRQYPKRAAGDRKVTTVLTIHPKDKDGNQRWELADSATLDDVIHLGCRSARYTPATANNSCSPAKVRTTGFPVNPGGAMPVVNGCHKQDYAVLIVVGLPATH
jgi:hypothetical protein